MRPKKYVAPQHPVKRVQKRKAPKNIVEFPVDWTGWQWDQYMVHRPRTEAEAVMEAGPFTEPDVSIEERQGVIEAVREALDELEPDQRMLLDAIVFERRSFRYLERLWCIPKSTLYRWYAAAILELRIKLIEYPEIIEYLERNEASDSDQ